MCTYCRHTLSYASISVWNTPLFSHVSRASILVCGFVFRVSFERAQLSTELAQAPQRCAQGMPCWVPPLDCLCSLLSEAIFVCVLVVPKNKRDLCFN